MNSATIRSLFLEFFASREHTPLGSSSLVPADDPTLLFTNAGMVQFKRTFLGQEHREDSRAVTCQKCVRAGGKHNDLEQVGLTRRHHTFFEMLGNFSFGDYFKREAIDYAWEFVTSPKWLGIDPRRLRVSVHHSDEQARDLWIELTGIPSDRVYSLGDADNFWQMGDTGPCGPCSEIFVDLEWKEDSEPEKIDTEEFERLAEEGRFLEIWNLVFMQFDRSADGTLTPLPRPSVDTGAGLERIAAVMQGKDDNFHTELFRKLIAKVEELVGSEYPGGPEGTGISFRVIADHARAVSFLLLDGVYPSNDGRGFVLRRILRRAVRHAWLLGRREPTLSQVIPTVIEQMEDAYPELRDKRDFLIETVDREEERFLETIEAGLTRLEEFFATDSEEISGAEAFTLYDTFGFPIDLTELIAAEHGVRVDSIGFKAALEEQRARSRAARSTPSGASDGLGEDAGSELLTGTPEFIGYNETERKTEVLSAAIDGADARMLLAETPFYPGGGGQVADTGTVSGDGWSMEVSEVVRDSEGRGVLVGKLTGDYSPGVVLATVDHHRRRDIQRNHSATHLVHLALREILGGHVRQQGSLVEAGRLRFDFSHHGPIEPSQLSEIEAMVNELVLANAATSIEEVSYPEAVKRGAMAFFADKYGDLVRVVTIGESMELCGGTHVASAGEIGLFRFSSQGGVAAGVRRIEAVTGRVAYQEVLGLDQRLGDIAGTLKSQPDQLERKLASVIHEREKLETRLNQMLESGPAAEQEAIDIGGAMLYLTATVAEDRAQLGQLADRFRESRGTGSLLLIFNPTSPTTVAVAATDDLIAKGKDANALMKVLAGRFAGRGGGRKTFASGSLTGSVEELAREAIPGAIREWLEE